MSTEQVEGQTAEEELQDKLELLGEDLGDKQTVTRIVDLIKEIIDDRAAEKAEEAIGNHTDNYDHDLMYQ